jgi:hypothetical protein
MTVTPFCYPAFAFMFTGLVNSRIQSRHGNDFAGTFKLIDVSHPSQRENWRQFCLRYLLWKKR